MEKIVNIFDSFHLCIDRNNEKKDGKKSFVDD